MTLQAHRVTGALAAIAWLAIALAWFMLPLSQTQWLPGDGRPPLWAYVALCLVTGMLVGRWVAVLLPILWVGILVISLGTPSGVGAAVIFGAFLPLGIVTFAAGVAAVKLPGAWRNLS